MQNLILGIIILGVIAYFIFYKRTKSLNNAIEKVLSGKLKFVQIKQSLEQIRNIIQAHYKKVAYTDKAIIFEYKECEFIIVPSNTKEVIISLSPSNDELEKFEEKKLAIENEENTFASEFLFKTKESSISQLAKSYALVSLETSFYIMENNQLIQVDSEEQTIKNIAYEKNHFKESFQLINNLPQEPKQIVRASFLELGLNGYLLGLAIAGGIVQPLKSYPANGEYILVFNSLSFQIIFYDDDIVECQLYVSEHEKIEDDEIPF